MAPRRRPNQHANQRPVTHPQRESARASDHHAGRRRAERQWAGIPSATPKDWIGLFAPAAPPPTAKPATWVYTTDQAGGQVGFPLPAAPAPGSYELRLFVNDTFTLLATSNPFVVIVPPPGQAPSDPLAAIVTTPDSAVLRINGAPLAQGTIQIGDATAQTDATGRCLLSTETAGHVVLVVDGRSANSAAYSYGVYVAGLGLAEGETTVLPYTVWMTRLDTVHTVTSPSPTTEEVVLTTPALPSLEVRIPHGARVVYPNSMQAAPGTRVDFRHYDSLDRGWYVYGRGTVTADGARVVTDPETRWSTPLGMGAPERRSAARAVHRSAS